MSYLLHRLLVFIDNHPRTGWYVAIVVTADFLLHIAESTRII